MDAVHDLERRIQKAKDNVEEIQTIVRAWVSPILERKDSKRESLLVLEDCQDRLQKCYSLVRESGQRIHSLLKVRGTFPRAWLAPHRLLVSALEEMSGAVSHENEPL